MAVSVNIVIIFIAYTLLRVEFYLENRAMFAQTLTEGHLLKLFLAGVRFDAPAIFYTNALYVLLMLLPLHCKERPRWYAMCKWIFIVVNALAICINLADSVYFAYTLKRTTWSFFSEFGSGTEFGKIIWVELLSHWYLVIFAAILIWGIWKLYQGPAIDINRQPLVKYYIAAVLSLAVAGLTVVTGIRGGLLNHWYNYVAALPLAYIAWRLLKVRRKNGLRIGAGVLCGVAACALLATAPIGGLRHRDIRPIAISNANAYAARPVESVLVLNTTFTLIRSAGHNPYSDPHYFDNKQQLDAIYTPIHHPADSLATGKKNLVVIIIESFGKEYIGGMNKEFLGEEYKGYTPFTDSLLNHSAWWRHSFGNSGQSIDAMPSVLASIPRVGQAFITTPYASNHIKGIPALLGEIGYQTAFFHGARTGSMGFDAFARSAGFESYYGREDFEKDPRFGGASEFDNYWGIWDEPFLQFFAAKMTEMKQPFMTALFTLSNHHPFQIPERYKGKLPEGTLEIHKTVGYTDNALRQFFATARRQPWYDNTIFVIVNDHTNMSGHDEYRSDIGRFCGPVIFFDPSGEITPGEREGIVQQIDIMPTMVDRLGYDKPYLAYGIDILATPADDTWAVNNANGIYQYVKYGYVLQWDGQKTTGVYAIDDMLMKNNLVGKVDRQTDMERELKAIIQSYMDRMLGDRLTADHQ